MFDEFLKDTFMGNTVLDYLKAAAMIVAGIFVAWGVKMLVLRRLQNWASRTRSRFDDYIFSSVDKYVSPLIYFGIVYVGLRTLDLNKGVDKALAALASVLVTVIGILFLRSFVQFLLLDLRRDKDGQATAKNHYETLMPAITTAIWVIGTLFLLDNLGFKISAIVAGLGIGGVAVALASSALLADLFAYFVIMFDKPFVVGDFIIVGDFMGAVEKIGIKTTRIRSLGGELLVFSNKDLTDSRLRNYKVMAQRRVEFFFNLVYDTPLDKLKEVPGIVKNIITGMADARFDRAHFASFEESSLKFAVVYYVLSADYNKYMDIQQEINFKIKEELEKRSTRFAIPARDIRIQAPERVPAMSES